MNRNLKVGIGIGGPSIIMIFVVLSLTTLGALSLVTAKSDWNLTKKTADSVSRYYAADGEIEEILASIDASVQAGHPLEANTFYVEAGENQQMVLTLKELGDSYIVMSRKLINTTYWDYEEYKTVFDDILVE